MSQTDTANSRAQEAKIIARARAGDRDALRALVELHNDRLFAFIWRMIRNHHDAEEVCQDAFLKAFSSLDSFSCEFRFSTWLFTIAYRVCLNRLRRKRVVMHDVEWSALAGREDDTPAALESEEAGRLRERVWAAVERLSVPQRATVLLFYRYEMGCQDIARVLELPVATVKSHLHRARQRLRDSLESLHDEALEPFCNRSAQSG